MCDCLFFFIIIRHLYQCYLVLYYKICVIIISSFKTLKKENVYIFMLQEICFLHTDYYIRIQIRL